MSSLSHRLAKLSAVEMVAALGVKRLPALGTAALELPFYAASRALGETLARFDDTVPVLGLPTAARQALERCRVTLQTSGAPLAAGPTLVLANHPGAYDALALMSALGRRDLRILAADRSFLRALPQLSAHLCFVGESAGARASALKQALRHLQRGGALLHFPAGEIEPDAAFEPGDSQLLKPWHPGVPALIAACARVDGRVVVAGVRGVHSPSAKRWQLNRWAERRGVTTLSPLLQLVARLSDVVTHVACCDAGSAAELSQLAPTAQQANLRSALERAIRASPG